MLKGRFYFQIKNGWCLLLSLYLYFCSFGQTHGHILIFKYLLNPDAIILLNCQGGVLSTAGPTPLATQAAGLMQSSIAVTQQPVPVFRPAGVHISHYPPNYIPYGHYYSPFFVPPPLHQYLGNSAFPQQPPAGSVYPAPPPAPATGVKYSLPQYKPGTNTGNPAHMGMPGGYGPYGSPPAGYNPSSAATTGNSNSNEDLNVSQFKESNVYISGQQVSFYFPFLMFFPSSPPVIIIMLHFKWAK